MRQRQHDRLEAIVAGAGALVPMWRLMPAMHALAVFAADSEAPVPCVRISDGTVIE